MDISRRTFLAGSGLLAGTSLLAGCGCSQSPKDQEETGAQNPNQYKSLLLDMTRWHYDKERDLYYQLNIPYCLHPAMTQYETVSLYVPGPYFSAEKTSSGYSCKLNKKGVCGDFTAGRAPVLVPINCSGYDPQAAQTKYEPDGLEAYVQKGYIYAVCGCRGKNDGFASTYSSEGFVPGGFPATLCDLKSAIRFLRLNFNLLGASAVYALGVAQGGFLASLLGVSGNAKAFDEGLDALGAARWNHELKAVGDNLDGVCVWTPELALNYQDAAYEWLFGQYSETGSRTPGSWTAALSKDLAKEWGIYVDTLKVPGENGEELSLDPGSSGQFIEGSLYNELLKVAEKSATQFLTTTAFPFEAKQPDDNTHPFPGDAQGGNEGSSQAQMQQSTFVTQTDFDTQTAPEYVQGSFKDVRAYLSRLNANQNWLTFSSKAHITSLKDVATQYSLPSLECTCYDSVECNTPQNQLFGTQKDDFLHFSRCIADVISAHYSSYSTLSGWSEDYVVAWNTDLEKQDAEKLSVSERASEVNQFDYTAQANEVSVAPFWRIQAGLLQGIIPWSQSYLLAKALETCPDMQKVDYSAIWNGGLCLCEEGTTSVEPALQWISEHHVQIEPEVDTEDNEETSEGEAAEDAS